MILLTVVSQGSQRRTVYERAICSTNFPPRNAAVQRVPVPKKGRTELEFVMNGMRQKWCMACFCNVIGFYQLLSFWPETTGPRTQPCFKSIEKPGFVSPFQGVQQGILGSPAIPRLRPSATRAPLAVARTPGCAMANDESLRQHGNSWLKNPICLWLVGG